MHVAPGAGADCLSSTVNYSTRRADQIDHRFPLDDLIFQGRYNPDLYDLYDLYDLAHVVGWKPYTLHDMLYVFSGLDLYYTDAAPHPVDYLDHDLSDLSGVCTG